MVKLYTEKPIPKAVTDPNAKNDEDTSLFQQHNSGKVQHSVIARKTLSQVNALQEKVERIHMAEDSVNLNTQVSGNYITTHKGDEVKTDLTHIAQTHEQTTQADDLIQHEVEQHTQTIEADNLSRHYTAPNVNFDYNQINHITGGNESISSSKNINMVSQNFNLTADSHQISAVTVNGGGKVAEVEAGHMHIDANKAVFQIGSSMNVSAGDYNGSMPTHLNRSYAAYRSPEEQANPDFVYIKDVIYSAQSGTLYFLNAKEAGNICSAEREHLSDADMLVRANADDQAENNNLSPVLQSYCTSLNDGLKQQQAISKAPQQYWVIHLGAMRMSMLDKTELDQLTLSLPFTKDNIQNKKVDWTQLTDQLKSQLELPYKKVIIENDTALNDSIKDLSTQLDDPDQTAWLDVGADPRQNLLYSAMAVATNTHFKALQNPQMYAAAPHVNSFFFLGDKALTTHRDYQVAIDDQHGIMQLQTQQFIYDSEPLLTQKIGLKQNQATKAYQLITNGSDYTAFASDENQNRISAANLTWGLSAELEKHIKTKTYLVGRYHEADSSQYPTRTSSDTTVAYSVQYNQANKEWYLFTNMQRFLVNGEDEMLDDEQIAQKAQDYPASDYLPLTAEHTDYNFEAFMYYQYILSDYQFNESIILQSDAQQLQDYYIQLVLDAGGIDKQASDLAQITEASDQASFAVELAQAILGLPMSGEQTLLISILMPDVVGRIWYALNQYQNLESDQQDPGQIAIIQQAFYNLSIWIWGTSEYEQLLQHYQAFGEYEPVDQNDSVQSIWQDDTSLFSINPQTNTAQTNLVLGIHNYFNASST